MMDEHDIAADAIKPAPETAGLLAVEPAYRHVLRIQLLLAWLPLIFAALVLDAVLLAGTGFRWLPTVALPLFAAIAIVAAPRRIHARLRYGMTETLLRVVRGWLFHVDTIVPFVRVQHLDVKRGPLDKAFGTATLVVHTAGTHNSIVTLPGLSPDRAAQIRETIRDHVRTDFA